MSSECVCVCVCGVLVIPPHCCKHQLQLSNDSSAFNLPNCLIQETYALSDMHKSNVLVCFFQ